MKKIFALAFAGIFSLMFSASAQIGIGTVTPGNNAMLNVESPNKGVLIPRIDYNNRPSTAVENGMLIYVTANGPVGNNSFYYYDGSAWLKVKNSNDNQTLSLSHDTLSISQANYVVLGSIFTMLGYTNCPPNGYFQLASNSQNCGSCGNVCSFVNGTGVCQNGTCNGGTCNSGFGNCNNINADGCEINLTNNISNCGSCGNACPTPANGTPSCAGSTCGIGACNAGFFNCNNVTADGCEINVTNNPSNCGSCGNVCPSVANATAGCSGSICGIAACSPGFANCNGNPADGCEINTSTSISNCGGCGIVCNLPNATASCAGGSCAVSACNPSFRNCDNNPANGCEINITNDVNNCGNCGATCGAVANGIAACSTGSCQIAACNSGFRNCNGIYSDGCETNINTSTSNCGNCGVVCPAGHPCVGGVCQ